MSILDKPLSEAPRRPSRRVIIVLGMILLIVALFVCSDVHADANAIASVWHFLTPPSHYTYTGHTDYVSSVAWSPDGKRIASASGDGTVQVWDAASGKRLYTYRGHSGDVLTAAWSPDGSYIASGGVDGTVQVWDAGNGKPLNIYRGHSDAVFDVAPDGARIASASNDGTVQVWNVTANRPIFTFRSIAVRRSSAPPPWNAVAWSPDGKRLAIGGTGDVEVFDADTGANIVYYGHHGGIVHAIAWSPNGKYIAIGASDTTVQVWDVTTGQNVYNFTGHAADVLTVAWSPDGKRIASGSGDGIVQVWDATTGNHAYTYRGHADYYPGHFTSNEAVNSLAWSPDGKHIASGSSDMTVQVWTAMS